MLDRHTEVRPGLHDPEQAVPEPAQVSDDVGAVTEEIGEELDVGYPRDRPVRPVVEAIQRVDLVRLDGEAEQPRDGSHDEQTDEHRAEEQHIGDSEGFGVELPAGQGQGLWLQQRGDPRDRGKHQVGAADQQRGGHSQQVQQLQDGEDEPALRPAGGGAGHPVLHRGPLCWGAVPMLTGGHRLPGVQRGGVAQLRPIAHRGADVKHGRFADEDVLAEGDRARLDHPGVRPVAGERGVLTDDRAGADGEQVGAHRHGRGKDRHTAPDFRAQRPQVKHVERRAGKSGQRAGSDQCFDDPEAEVGQAPERDLLRLPPADEQPFRHDWQGAHAREADAAEYHRPQVDVEQTGCPGDPLVASDRAVRGQVGVAEHEQQLQRSAQDVPGRAGGRRDLGRRWGRSRGGGGRGRRERGGRGRRG